MIIGYDKAGFIGDSDLIFDTTSNPAISPRGEPGSRFGSFIQDVRDNRENREIRESVSNTPSRLRGAVVVFNMMKRRVRHSYPTGSGVIFLLWDSVGDFVYAGTSTVFCCVDL